MGVAVEIKGLKKSYLSPGDERTLVVDVPGFSIQAGEQVALAGRSGTGKTTFLNLIAGILRADAGSIMLGETDIAVLGEGARDAFRAMNIGYVFQTFNLLQGMTALENVALGMAFGAGVDYGYARKALDRVGLSHRLDYKPRQLSVGQQQRVALARAVANRPKLLLADEPTANLDAKFADESLAWIREMCNQDGTTLLLVSHDPRTLSQFTRVEELATINKAAAGNGRWT